MTPTTREDRSLTDTLLDLLHTGSLAFGLGFVIWFALLFVDGALVFDQLSRHTHQPGHPVDSELVSLVGSDRDVALGYAMAFFLGSLFAARTRLARHTAISALAAYAVFLALYLPFLDWSRGPAAEWITLLIPLLTAPLGGFLGERVWSSRRRAEENHG